MQILVELGAVAFIGLHSNPSEHCVVSVQVACRAVRENDHISPISHTGIPGEKNQNSIQGA